MLTDVRVALPSSHRREHGKLATLPFWCDPEVRYAARPSPTGPLSLLRRSDANQTTGQGTVKRRLTDRGGPGLTGAVSETPTVYLPGGSAPSRTRRWIPPIASPCLRRIVRP